MSTNTATAGAPAANEPKRPVAERRDGPMKIAIWRQEPREEGGRVYFQSKLTHSFKAADGTWQETDYLSGSENLRASNLHAWAYNKELELRQAERDAPSP